MTEGTMLTKLGRILAEHRDVVLAAGGKEDFERDYGELTPRTLF